MISFNNSQILGLDLDKHIALDAGAGTGKTAVMAERYVQHLISSEQRATILLPNGPREPLEGHGALRAPARERTDLKSWPGLLPNEIVAITFTKKAAAELKSRIRTRLALTRSFPVANGEKGIFDPRIHRSGDLEMLLSGLDEAPISTIDAFLSQLVSPHLDLVAIHPTREQISEVRSPLLVKETIRSAWRIRTPNDAREAGVRGDVNQFIAARNRLAILVGGQARAEVILTGMLNTSLFVEESKRSMKKRISQRGLKWDGLEPIDSQIIFDMFLEPADNIIDSFADKLHQLLNKWVDEALSQGPAFVVACEAEQGTQKTRFNHLVELARHSYPSTKEERLQWVWMVSLASASYSSLIKGETTFFPKGVLPQVNHSNEWMPGLFPKSKVRGIPGTVKDRIAKELINQGSKMNLHLSSQDGRLIRLLGRSSFLFSPMFDLNYMENDCPLRVKPLDNNLTDIAPTGKLRIAEEQQTKVLADLLLVHYGCQEILTLKKVNEGVHDFDDVQRLAADLLLARCPDSVRFEYPEEVVEVLDSLDDEPWLDLHISAAMTLAKDHPKCLADLQQRFSILQSLRRRFCAFIIDEYQDTNPAHFRLLSRLWGRRGKNIDDPEKPLGPWDPTVCIVGDMKQSIYRFRQAEVTVMRRTVESIKSINYIEQSEPRLSHLRKANHGRDPRPKGAGGEIGSFSNQHSPTGTKIESKPWDHVCAEFEDSPKGVKKYVQVSKERLSRRLLGHIDLTSNHRTLHNIMRTMNGIFNDVFDGRHYTLPGDWHAEAQELKPARDDDKSGTLEWLLPLQTATELPPLDLEKVSQVFADSNAKSIHLEHELIALRLHSLLSNKSTKLWDSETSSFIEIKEETTEIMPKDITILVHSRKHIPDLLQRLELKGIPVISDRQGELLQRPVVKALMAVLHLVAYPKSKFAAVSFARSPILGLTDGQIHDIFTNHKIAEDWWSILHDSTSSKRAKNLVHHLSSLAKKGAIHQVLDAVLDHSDLLITYPDDTSRQNAELWCGLVYNIGTEYGHEPTEIYSHLKSLQGLANKGPQAITIPSGGAVRIMTIHGAKGLQSKVVVVAGMFHAGKSDSSLAARNNVLVTPEIVSGRINPWASRDRPYDGLWEFAKTMDGAQRQAERRREFYVALTRVKDRLIVVGAPNTDCKIDKSTNNLSFKSKPSMKTMGAMWMDGIRYLSYINKVEDSPWLLPKDDFDKPLDGYSETQVSINPYMLFKDSMFGGDNIDSIRVYHSPECFETISEETPLAKWKNIEKRALEAINNPKTPVINNNSNIIVQHRIRMSAHGLDSTFQCPRRHWLTEIKGWDSQPFYLKDAKNITEYSPDKFSSPTLFGTLMHRLLEVGLKNPASVNHPPTLPLPESWINENKNRLGDKKIVEEVLLEEGITTTGSTHEKERAIAMNERLHHLSKLADAGLIGRYAQGEVHHNRIPEGLRTELPFFYQNIVQLSDIYRLGFTVDGLSKLAKVEGIEISFEGRADLVLAFRDKQGQGYLQVSDLKTTGCRGDFNPFNPSKGSPLQLVDGDPMDIYPQTEAEVEILHEHRLQLTLYSMALEAIELDKPIDKRRKILPPSILIGASGRSVELTEQEYVQSKKDLQNHLNWIAELAAEPKSLSEPERLEGAENATCMKCPFYRGDIKLCGPKSDD
jgi:ATP-dependent exoDNAse (exonuclease V) beta subunit